LFIERTEQLYSSYSAGSSIKELVRHVMEMHEKMFASGGRYHINPYYEKTQKRLFRKDRVQRVDLNFNDTVD